MERETAEMARLRERVDGSEVFRVSREEQPGRYRILAYELVEDLYRYTLLVSRYRYEDMGLEIVETVHSCLRSYDAARGPFLHYFLSALGRRTRKERAVRAEEARQYVCSLDMGWSDGDEPVLEPASSAPLPEELLLDRHNIRAVLDTLESGFLLCRTGQREVLSKLLTARLLKQVPELSEELARRAFFDREVWEQYRAAGQAPTARELSRQMGKNEASVSRTLSRFVEKLDLKLSNL